MSEESIEDSLRRELGVERDMRIEAERRLQLAIEALLPECNRGRYHAILMELKARGASVSPHPS